MQFTRGGSAIRPEAPFTMLGALDFDRMRRAWSAGETVVVTPDNFSEWTEESFRTQPGFDAARWFRSMYRWVTGRYAGMAHIPVECGDVLVDMRVEDGRIVFEPAASNVAR